MKPALVPAERAGRIGILASAPSEPADISEQERAHDPENFADRCHGAFADVPVRDPLSADHRCRRRDIALRHVLDRNVQPNSCERRIADLLMPFHVVRNINGELTPVYGSDVVTAGQTGGSDRGHLAIGFAFAPGSTSPAGRKTWKFVRSNPTALGMTQTSQVRP